MTEKPDTCKTKMFIHSQFSSHQTVTIMPVLPYAVEISGLSI